LLAAVGRGEEALALAHRLATDAEQRGDADAVIGTRSVKLSIHAARGETEAALAHAEPLLDSARKSRSTDLLLTLHPAVAAALVAAGRPDEARDLLAEVDDSPTSRTNLNYPLQLPRMVRTALAAQDPDLADRLSEGIEAAYPLHEHALRAAHATRAESAGEHAEAAALYREAAERWREFGNLPEHAQALLGQGRCLLALGRAGAEQPLRQARELFVSMGCTPAIAETEAVLADAAPTRGA
jgi:tetratricopeptide (TPR) repeat protein